MSWEALKSTILSLLERISQTNLHTQEPVLKPIPVNSQHPQQPRQPR